MLLVLVVLVVLLLSINVHGLLPVSTSYYTQKNRVSYKISSVNRANTYGNGPLSSIVSCTSTAARTVTIRTIVTAATKRSVSTTALLLSRCDEYADFVTKPRWGGRIVGPVLRYLNDFAVGIIFTVVMRIMNKFRSHRREALLNAIFKRPKGQGLLTVSNHQSFFDDPGIWAAVLPWWRIRPDRLRWSLCTEDVFFYVSYS